MTECVLEVQEVCKRFGAVQASNKVNLDLRSGEIHALIGPNGAGKSTLIQQISGALRPDSGRIILNNTDVTKLNTVARVKRGLARTFQVSALAMEDTALQNVLLGVVAANGKPFSLLRSVYKDLRIRTLASDSLERVGLADQAMTRVAELSHGQRRQLEIAIALTLQPRAFVMDEPMAGLGTQGSEQLTVFLDSLRLQAPILLVEHDMDAVFALADRISVLVYGEVLASGTVAQIRANEAVRNAYLGSEL